jgi:hypothetical protein
MAIQTLYPLVQPSLNLDFANTKRLDPRVTFTRASAGRVYDGRTVAKAEENLVLSSQTFDDGNWSKLNATVLGNTSDTTAPDGTSTAEKITDDSTNSVHRFTNAFSISLIAGQAYALSVFVKAGTHDFVQILLRDGAAENRYITVIADLSTQTISQTQAGTSATLTSSSIVSAGNDWYRISMIGSLSAVGSNQLGICFAPAASGNTISTFGTISYVGTGTNFYVWGAQLEQRSAVTAYTPTTTQAITNYIPVLQSAADNVARFDHDPVTGESLGFLVEEQRVNLLTYSEQFDDASWNKTDITVTANSNIAPDGTLTADLLTEGSAGTAFLTRGTVATVSSGATITGSFYVKRSSVIQWARVRLSNGGATNGGNVWFDIQNGVLGASSNVGSGTATSGTITAVGNGWYRISATTTLVSGDITGLILINSASADSSFTRVSGSAYFLWGAQLE